MNHVVSFSTGLSSAITVERVLQSHSGVYVVFMDTTLEDEDNYRFRDECYSRWRRLYPTTRFVELREGRDPYQVSRDQNIIPNQRRHPCTWVLKIEPFRNWLRENDLQGLASGSSEVLDGLIAGVDQAWPNRNKKPSKKVLRLLGDLKGFLLAHTKTKVYIGYDFMEIERTHKSLVAYGRLGVLATFPLLWKPYEFRPYTEVCQTEWGISPPRMYSQGYSHANCGGRCVAQGIGDWVRTLTFYPERFEQSEIWEREMRSNHTNASYALCRDQSNGTVRARTLTEVRENAQNLGQMELFGAGCFSCGIGDFSE